MTKIQYSIWPSDRDNAIGSHDEGYASSRRECLAHIDEVWRDMRPRSVCERKIDDPTDGRHA
jgi:MbtH protein